MNSKVIKYLPLWEDLISTSLARPPPTGKEPATSCCLGSLQVEEKSNTLIFLIYSVKPVWRSLEALNAPFTSPAL